MKPQTSDPMLVAGIGLPWIQDLDLAMRFVRQVEGLEWPEHVVVEDLSLPAHHVLDRLLEVGASRVMLVAPVVEIEPDDVPESGGAVDALVAMLQQEVAQPPGSGSRATV